MATRRFTDGHDWVDECVALVVAGRAWAVGEAGPGVPEDDDARDGRERAARPEEGAAAE